MAFPTTGLHSRYEARNQTGYVSGDLAGTITDQSGAGLHLTQGTSPYRPQWVSGVLNGQAVFRFDGVDDHVLAAPAAADFATFSMTVVASSTPGEASSRVWPFGVNSSTTRIMGFTEGVPAGEWGTFLRYGGTAQQPTAGVDTTAWTVLTVVWDGSVARFYRNGTLISTAPATGTLTVAAIAMGALAALTTECFSGDIALVATWATALDDARRADLHSYVQDTYGITVADYQPPDGGTTVTGSGALAAAAASLSGSGTVTTPVTGSGALAAGAAALSGSGAVRLTGSGALVAPAAEVTGSGTVTITGTGALTAGAPTLSGDGYVPGPISGGGSLTAAPATLTGSGTLTIVGAGELAAQAATLAGAALVSLTGSGTLTAGSAVLTASGVVVDPTTRRDITIHSITGPHGRAVTAIGPRS